MQEGKEAVVGCLPYNFTPGIAPMLMQPPVARTVSHVPHNQCLDEVCCDTSRFPASVHPANAIRAQSSCEKSRVIFSCYRALDISVRVLMRRNRSPRALKRASCLPCLVTTNSTRRLTMLSITPMPGLTTRGSTSTTKAVHIRWPRRAPG